MGAGDFPLLQVWAPATLIQNKNIGKKKMHQVTKLWIKKQTNSLLIQTLIHLLKRGDFAIPVRLTENTYKYSTMSSFESARFYEVFISFGFSCFRSFWFHENVIQKTKDRSEQNIGKRKMNKLQNYKLKNKPVVY